MVHKELSKHKPDKHRGAIAKTNIDCCPNKHKFWNPVSDGVHVCKVAFVPTDLFAAYKIVPADVLKKDPSYGTAETLEPALLDASSTKASCRR